VIVASFKTPETMFAAGRWEFTLRNYVELMSTGFWRNILNSLVLCLVSVAISTVLAVNAAYAFSRCASAPSARSSPRCCSARPSRGSCW
jgi:ABC-type spermidine/putrescine transport system permease subunit II